MITIEQELFSETLDEMVPLFMDHYEEICQHKELLSLNPNFDMYLAAEEHGKLVLITAREDGVLLGYSMYLVVTHPHYKDTILAQNDIIFIKKEKRKGSLGIKLIKASEAILKNIGVEMIIMRTKKEYDFGSLLNRLGYTPEEVLYTKVTGE